MTRRALARRQFCAGENPAFWPPMPDIVVRPRPARSSFFALQILRVAAIQVRLSPTEFALVQNFTARFLHQLCGKIDILGPFQPESEMSDSAELAFSIRFFIEN